MAPFRFSLEKVLRYREHLTSLAEEQFRDANNQVNRLTERLQALYRERDDAWGRFAEKAAAGLPAGDAAEFYRFAGYLVDLIEKTTSELAEAKQLLAKKREELAQAMREEKVLSKLKEQKWQEYRAIQTSAAQKNLDELAGISHWRTAREGGTA